MSELHDWLLSQHPGLRTHKAFQKKALELASRDGEHRALYRLLASMVGRYIEWFDEEPLPPAVAERAYQLLLELAEDAERSIGAPPVEQVKVLNKVAAAELF
jgi:hypothetical protein